MIQYIAALELLTQIWEAANQRKFQENIIKWVQSLVEQINTINRNQMKEISDILTRFEWIQYWLIIALVGVVMIFSYFHIVLLRRVKTLELHQK